MNSLLIFALCFARFDAREVLVNASYYLNGTHLLEHYINNTHRLTSQWSPVSSHGFHLQLYRNTENSQPKTKEIISTDDSSSSYKEKWEKCEDALVDVNTRYYQDMQSLQNCEGDIIRARADLANCLGQNVGLRTEIDNLNNGTDTRDNSQKLEDCYQTCDRKFWDPNVCGDQCDRYRDDCLGRCRMLYL